MASDAKSTSGARPRPRMKRWKKVVIVFFLALVTLAVVGYATYGVGEHEDAGEVHSRPVPRAVVDEKRARQSWPGDAARRPDPGQDNELADAAMSVDEGPGDQSRAKQILFGDLHVHSTFSVDAFLRSLPLAGGEGAHPPADACDFARFCSSLDFFALTDHAEGLTPRHWRETKESIRQCNAVAGDASDPDLVAFAGWEWSQVGQTPETHYGHKNVIFRDTEDDRLPARPIGASGLLANAFRGRGGMSLLTLASIPVREFSRRQRYLNLVTLQREILAVDACPTGVDSRSLPEDCREVAPTPAELFEKLAQWQLPTLVIPHGTTWGFYTPPGYEYDKQIARAQHDPGRERLIEVFSGHGNSEQYRPYRAHGRTQEGDLACPTPTVDFEPCCHRAGELIRARCGDLPADECEARVAKAQLDYMRAGAAGHNTVPGATVADWGDCGQCRDCFAPSFSYRPGGAAQYILARGDFSSAAEDGAPDHVRLGFIASSDNHSARPGTGYKEFARRRMTEASGPISEEWRARIMGPTQDPEPVSRPFDATDPAQPPFKLTHLDRQASFFMTGGLVAVHSEGRSREAVWDALMRREVYGTSGPRILLYFDLANGPDGPAPMGSEVRMADDPRFAVRALGAFVQKEGCPDWVHDELDAERIDRLCAGECYHPSDWRHRIERIEVVRIRPQKSKDEDMAELIEDPWLVLPCQGSPCQVEFEDPDFVRTGRETAYYVRAIQEYTPAVNARNVRCQDESCTEVAPCYGDYRTPYSDDCLSDNQERAWSSPIYIDPARAPGSDK